MSRKGHVSGQDEIDVRKPEKSAADSRYCALLLSVALTAFPALLYFRADFSGSPASCYALPVFTAVFAVLFILCPVNCLRGKN